MKKLSMEELNRMSPEEYATSNKFPYVIVLDDIRSMNNVGSALRTADAFAAHKVYMCGITATPPHRDISKTALGADETVAWQHASDALALCVDLQKKGYQVVAVEQIENSTMLPNFVVDKNKKYAFVFGNEVMGVNEAIVKMADVHLEIPQFGTKHSLNIGVSLGVVCWETVRQLL